MTIYEQVMTSDRLSEGAKQRFLAGFAKGANDANRINFGKPLCRLRISLGDPRAETYCMRRAAHEGPCSPERD